MTFRHVLTHGGRAPTANPTGPHACCSGRVLLPAGKVADNLPPACATAGFFTRLFYSNERGGPPSASAPTPAALGTVSGGGV